MSDVCFPSQCARYVGCKYTRCDVGGGGPEEVGTDHVSDHALRFSSDVSIGRMYRLSFCRNCES